MENDRNKIYKIISEMLDNPDKHGLYPTSTAYTKLELFVESVRFEAVGWTYAYCCSLLDKGRDPRTEIVPEIIDAAKKDLR